MTNVKLKESQHPTNRRLIGSKNNGGLFGKIKIYCPLSEFELPLFRPAAWSLHRSMICQFHNLQESFQNYQVWRVLLISYLGAYVARLVFDNFGFYKHNWAWGTIPCLLTKTLVSANFHFAPPPYQIQNEDTQWNKKNALVWRLGGGLWLLFCTNTTRRRSYRWVQGRSCGEANEQRASAW
jgi:hypothetical protein